MLASLTAMISHAQLWAVEEYNHSSPFKLSGSLSNNSSMSPASFIVFLNAKRPFPVGRNSIMALILDNLKWYLSEQFVETRSMYWFFQESKNMPSESLTVSCTATLPMKLLKRCLLLDWSGLPLSLSFERLIARGQKLSIPNWRPGHLVVANSPIWICRPRGDILLYLKLVCKWMMLLKMNRISTFSCDTTETEYN